MKDKIPNHMFQNTVLNMIMWKLHINTLKLLVILITTDLKGRSLMHF